jgi:putative transposase
MNLSELTRVPAETKRELLETVALTRRRSGWRLREILAALGLPKSVYFEWRQREQASRLHDLAPSPPRLDALLDDEVAAIKAFALEHPRVGYRKLAWMMVDKAIAYVSESSVYRVLDAADLLHRWKRYESSSGEYRFKATGPNQQWHTDVMYAWVCGRHYFLLSFIDAFSRYVVHHKLLIDLNGAAVATELEAALAKAGSVQPRIVHDHGSEFINRDLRAVIKAHNLLDIKTRARHPESNGVAERFNGTVRDESSNDFGNNYLEAVDVIDKLVTTYNNERLHAALGYIEPREAHFGDLDARRELRAERLRLGRQLRRERNKLQLMKAKTAGSLLN